MKIDIYVLCTLNAHYKIYLDVMWFKNILDRSTINVFILNKEYCPLDLSTINNNVTE